MVITTGPVDMGDPALLRDPYAGYSRIRERAPLVRAAMPGVGPVWLATRYDDVRMVLSDPRFVVDPANVPGRRVPSLNERLLRSHRIPPTYLKYRMARMGLFDGAAHARLRTAVAPEFAARRIGALRPRIEEIAGELLGRLPRDAPVDLLGRFALPLSNAVLCDMVGIPAADRERWDRWREIVAPVTGAAEDKEAGWRGLVAYVRELIERRRAEPAGDLISGLARAGELDETEMIAMVVMLGMTSQQTAHLIASGTLALLTHPGQLAALRDGAGLMPHAVHELLRWCTPTQMPPRLRYAAEYMEIGGMPLRKGEPVAAMLVAANRDPRAFADPDRLDLARSPGGSDPPRRETHVAFGGGPHYCLGAALARLEAEAAFRALLRRDPSPAADPGDLGYEPIPGHLRLAALPVRLPGPGGI